MGQGRAARAARLMVVTAVVLTAAALMAGGASAATLDRTLRYALPHDGRPFALPEGAHVDEYVGDHLVRVVTEDGVSHVVASSEPLLAGGRPIDLKLRRAGRDFVPGHARTELRVPATTGRPVHVGRALALRIAGSARKGRRVGNAFLYRGVAPATDWAVAPTASGVVAVAHLRSRRSPDRLKFVVTLPAGSRLAATGDGGAVVRRGRAVLATLEPPRAFDVRGRSVAARYRVRGTAATIVVRHRGAALVHARVDDGPTLAPPGWTQSASRAKRFDLSGAGPAIAGRRLAAADRAAWTFAAPGTAVVTRTDFARVRFNGAGKLALGLDSTRDRSASPVRIEDVRVFGRGHAAEFALSGPGSPLASADGALVYMDDADAPGLAVAPPARGWLRSGSGTVALTGSDAGVGVAAFVVRRAGNRLLRAAIQCDARCPARATRTLSYRVDALPEGTSTLSVTALDAAGRASAARTWTVKVDRTGPNVTLAGALASQAGKVVSGTRALTVSATDARSGIARIETRLDGRVVDAAGRSCPAGGCAMTRTASVDFEGLEGGAHVVEVRVSDHAGNVARRTLAVRVDGGAAPVAPKLADTGATPIAAATEFLYKGADAIQTGVADGTIEPTRAAVLRGRVTDRNGAPLAGVSVTVREHPELGATQSRNDGEVYVAVNGGGPLTLRFERDGYLPADRTVTAPWSDYAWFDDVALVPLDAAVTEVDLGSPLAPAQVARGSVVSDGDGTRRASLLFAPATEASMRLPDGSIRPLDDVHVRATEFTVGSDGEAAMPAPLPPTSGYTYAAEFSVDEAIAAGAEEVRFTRPVISYTENFLGFPVGSPVPAGYYDREQERWVASDNGLVIEIVAEHGGLAEVDVDGSGTPASAGDLADLGIDETEQRQLADLYAPGTELWRVPITHFTPWDFNWPWGPPNGARGPNGVPRPGDPDYCATCQGSVIEAESQVLGEDLDITGTGRTLHYRSNRAPGFRPDSEMTIPLAGDDLPPGLQRIDLSLEIAGRKIEQSFTPEPDLDYDFRWDGRDAFGRAVTGGQPLTATVSYVYTAAKYEQPADFVRSFGQSGGEPLANRTRGEIALTQTLTRMLGADRPGTGDIGAWTLGTHHTYDPATRTLWTGDGARISAGDLPLTATRLAGKPAEPQATRSPRLGRPSVDLGDVGDIQIGDPRDLDAAADGSVYIVDTWNHRVLRSTTAGRLERVAGTGQPGFAGDGGPALEAQLDRPTSVAVTADGSLLIADHDNQRIRRVDPDGAIATIAGSGDPAVPVSDGDGGPATEARLDEPESVAVTPDGAIAFTEADGTRVREIATDGTVTRIAGTGVAGFAGDGGDGTAAQLDAVSDLAFGPDGALYLADAGNHRIRRVGTDGSITTVAGSGPVGTGGGDFAGDGGAATDARLKAPRGVAVGPDGALYISDTGNRRLRKVDTTGVIATIAGDGNAAMGRRDASGSAADAPLISPAGLAVAANGDVLVAETALATTFRIAAPLPGAAAGDLLVPSADGDEVYRFSASGRHLDTRDALTGTVVEHFTYDSAGRLLTAVDGDGLVTALERDASGAVRAIVGPDGHRTTVTSGTGGRLDALRDPAGAVASFTYSGDGLLTAMQTPAGDAQFTYDAAGRLLSDADTGDGATTLLRADTPGGRSVQLTTAEGETATYALEDQSDGSRRRVVTDGAGLQTVSIERRDGSVELHDPTGVVTTGSNSADPRFGAAVGLANSMVEQMPSGLERSTSFSRSVRLTNPRNPLSVEKATDLVTVNGRTTETVFDAATRSYTETSPAGRQDVTTVDGQGRITGEQSPGLADADYEYDARGRLVTATEGDRVTRWSYDARGDVASVTDAEGRVWRYTYDAADRVTSQLRPDGATIHYGYDAAGNLASVTTPGNRVHLLEHSATGLRTSAKAPGAAAATTYAYDRDGRVTTIARPGVGAVGYDYDAAGRLAAVSEPRGDTTFAYDAQTGLPTGMTAPGGEEIQLGYDGDLVTREQVAGTLDATVDHTYDEDFALVRTEIGGGSAVDYTYDDDGLLTGAGALSLTLDPDSGRLASDVLGDVTTSYGYDPYDAVDSLVTSTGAGALLSIEIERDKVGRTVSRTETGAGGTYELAYSYDPAGRLDAVTRDGQPWVAYTYDANGNRTSATTAGEGTETAMYAADDRLDQAGGRTYTYDGAGFLRGMTEAGGEETEYAYTPTGVLTAVELPDGRRRDYVVDAVGRRIASGTDGTVEQRFLYAGGDSGPIAELDAGGAVRTRFVYGTSTVVPDYMVRDAHTYRLVTDERGSVRAVVDVASGDVAQAIEYDPYGRVLSDSAPGFQPFGFGGGLYDADTGLVHFGARDYDARTGRWLSRDPLEFAAADSNLYAYVFGDPVNLVDPSGLGVDDWVKDRYNDFTEQAEESGQWWADVAVNSDNPAARAVANVAGPLADLATHDNLPKTAATLIPGGRVLGKVVARCKGARIFKIERHGPHHTFGKGASRARRKHIQIRSHRHKVKGSHWKNPPRIPYGPRYPVNSGIPHNKI